MGTQSVALNLGGSTLWAPYKDLYSVVTAAIHRKDMDTIPDLEIALRRHKPDFISLLKNPPRSAIQKDAVCKAVTEGIAVVGQSGPQILPQRVVDESLIISDMFDLNEITALELLIAGQHQQPHFPGLTRGLVAMLLYYDGRRSLVNSLRILVQAREGRTWTLGLNTELVSMVTKYTDELKKEGLIMKLIDYIETMDLTKELDLLHKNRALGGPRYRKQVVDLIQEIRQSLAEVLFCWACQGTLSKEEVLRLMAYLAKESNIKGDGSFDDVTLTLVMVLLCVIDVSILQTCEDTDDLIKNLNLVVEPELAFSLHKELTASSDSTWQTQGLKAILQFTWGVTLRTLSQFPLTSAGIEFNQCIEDDEKTIDSAIKSNCFHALQKLVVNSSHFHQEEFFLKRIHGLITDFIVLMPLKVKELRNLGDETARIIATHMQEGLEPPATLSRDFEHMLCLISEIYRKDPLNLELALDYWCPSDTLLEQTYSQRPSPQQVSLYKFLRLAGDLLPAVLFVPYVQMLTSLSESRLCAHYCFSLLKMNGRNAGGRCSTVSWDHFFSSIHRYYNSLRQEVAVSSDSHYLYRQRLATRGIMTQEVEGLTAVLQLMTKVVKEDEVARITLYENPHYVPLMVLLGLVSCSVPPELKASLLETVAAFAVSPDIAFNTWQGLEASQIIPTVKTTSVYHPSGILMELEEVETRNEEFPITRSMLTLLSSLTDHPLPPSLGAGQRRPGLEPYLEYVRDSVLLRSTSRSYKNDGEKWEIIRLALHILEKLLQKYQVTADSFSNTVVDLPEGTTLVNGTHAGYSVMAHLLQDSGLLRMVLYILDEGVRVNDLYNTVAGQKHLDECTLLCLHLIQGVLFKQEAFLEQVRESGANLLVTSLENLLMSINPRTGHADHLVILAKYVTYNTMLPEHALAAVRILRLLCLSGQLTQRLVTFFTVSQKENETLLHGFVECLEVDDIEESETEEMPPENHDQSTALIRNSTRKQLLLLLLTCLEQPGPNLAHFLLGFNLRQPVSYTTLQEPGVLGSPRTCLHAVLSILDKGTDSSGFPTCIHEVPRIAELCFNLIYSLCFNKDTSGPTLRYLRSTHDFLYRHLQFLPFRFKNEGASLVQLLLQQSWLLRAVAIELRVTAVHHQRSHVNRLLHALLDDTPMLGTGRSDNILDTTSSTSILSQSSFIKPIAGPVRRKLIRILDSIQFDHTFPSAPLWEYFDSSEVERVMKECETRESDGLWLVNVEELHRKLSEVTSSQSGTGRALVVQEIPAVLQFCLKRNEAKEAVYAKKQMFEAWRQITEVVFTACPLDILSFDEKHQVVLEICQELLHKALSDNVLPELTSPISGIILTLLTTLHQSVVTSMPVPQMLSSVSSSALLSSVPTESMNISSSVQGLTQHSALLVVLRGIIDSMLKTGGGLQRVRANYYGALLNLLRIVQRPRDKQVNKQHELLEPAILDQESANEKLRREYVNTILNFGETIMEVVCRDACSGHDITRMLSLATLDVIVSLDFQQNWLAFLVSKGYLRHLIDSLLKDDEELYQILTQKSESHRTLYVFESKMVLLTRIAESFAGAQSLLRNGIMSRLTECRSLDLHPESSSYQQTSMEDYIAWLMPSSSRCYQQILTSSMKLILAILSTLGPHHREATQQLLLFIAGHMGMFSSVLRDRSAFQSLNSLEELSLMTAVLSQASLDDTETVAGDTAVLEHKGQLTFLHHQLLALLPQAVATETVPPASKKDSSTASQMSVLKLQVTANILRSCCATVVHSGRDAINCRVIFTSCLADATISETYYLSRKEAYTKVLTMLQPPGLGLLVALLNQSCSELQESAESHKGLLQQLQSIQTLTSEELAELLPSDVGSEPSTAQHQRELARRTLLQLKQFRAKEVSHLAYVIEASLFLLWHHLEYFLLHCTGEDVVKSVLSGPSSSMRKLNEMPVLNLTSSGRKPESPHPKQSFASKNDIDILKSSAQTVMAESFFRKLNSVEEYVDKGRGQVSFLQSLVHRIKRLVRLHTK